ncbi:hypothetical protein MMC25_004967 [Agyrium rufum]|nr:hypothetical protein [Agyrium rufum]
MSPVSADESHDGQDVLGEWLKTFYLDSAKTHALAQAFSASYTYLALHSFDQFLATPIVTLPNGKEKGLFLAIDFGGTNLRVGFIRLLGANEKGKIGFEGLNFEKLQEKRMPIGDHLKVEKAEDLFAWVGDCLVEVVDSWDECELPQELPLAITFSFPMIQKSLAEAILMPMGKGFQITSDPDLGKLVLSGYERSTAWGRAQPRKIRPALTIAAISNDAVATMMSLLYTTVSEPHTKVAAGLILGTGCNAATAMQIRSLHPQKVAPLGNVHAEASVVVNTEWTIRGTAAPMQALGLVTRWDEALSRALPTPGFQPFEYMTAGHYLGEVVRLIACEYYTSSLGHKHIDLPAPLLQSYALTTEFLSRVVTVNEDPIYLAEVLNGSQDGFGRTDDWEWTAKLTHVLQRCEQAVLARSAALIAAANLGLLSCIGDLDLAIPPTIVSSTKQAAQRSTAPDADPMQLIIAYIGGLITQYKHYKEDVQKRMDEVMAGHAPACGNRRIVLREAPDGGLIGAAALASTIWHP